MLILIFIRSKQVFNRPVALAVAGLFCFYAYSHTSYYKNAWSVMQYWNSLHSNFILRF